jgi:hypothetical protein
MNMVVSVTVEGMHALPDEVADSIAAHLANRATDLRLLANSWGFRGAQQTEKRAELRARAAEYESAMMALNGGDGVVRASAVNS